MEIFTMFMLLAVGFMGLSLVFGIAKVVLSKISKSALAPKKMLSVEVVKDHSQQTMTLSQNASVDHLAEDERVFKTVSGEIIVNRDGNQSADEYFGVTRSHG